jgi:hypothetical protein
MANPNADQADRALENQDEDEPVEILSDGTVRPVSPSPSDGEKRTILRDPKGEY